MSLTVSMGRDIGDSDKAINKEEKVMGIALHSASNHRGEWLLYYLLYGAAYPTLLLVEAMRRGARLGMGGVDDVGASHRSLFSEASENTHIAISHAFETTLF